MTAGRVKEITSLSNPIIKDLRNLAQKKHREREGLFLTEGLKLALEGLELGAKIRTLIYAGHDAQSKLAEETAARAYAGGALIIKANHKIMEAISRRDNAQNFIAVFESRWHSAEDILTGAAKRALSEEQAESRAPRLILALDRVRDPGNLGTIIRTADAAGVSGVILVGDTVSPFSLEAVRATMGSIFALPLGRASEEQFLNLMQRFAGLTVGTHLKGAADYRTIPYFDPHFGRQGAKKSAAGLGQASDTLLLMGNEQKGLSDRLAEACAVLARIPQAGRADSLNLAVSTGIMLFEICRSRLSL